MRLRIVLFAALALSSAGGSVGADERAYPSEEALARYVQGRLLEDRGDEDAALGEYFRAIAIDPGAVAPMLRISEIAARRGEFLRSVELAERAIASDSSSARAWWLLGASQFSLGRPAIACDACQRAVAAESERVEYWSTLSRIADSVQRFDEVARAASHVVMLDPDDGEAWFQLASAEARLGRFGAAQRSLNYAREAAPGRPGVHFLQGWISEGLGDTTGAIAAYRSHLQAFRDDGAIRRRIVQLLAGSGRDDEALAEARRISEDEPDDPEAWEVRAVLEFQNHHVEQGQAAVRRLESFGPDDARNLRRRVRILAAAGRKSEAVALARDWNSRRAGRIDGLMELSRALAATGNDSAAVTTALSAVALAPDSIGPRLLVAGLHQAAGRFDSAALAWRDVLTRAPDDVAARIELASCLVRASRAVEAEVEIREALRRDPDNATALNFLGYQLAEENRGLDEAESLIRRAVQQQPENGAFVDSMGWVLYRLGRLEQAKAELERAVRLTGGDPTVHEHLGDVYRDLQQPDLARIQYRKALSSDARNERLKRKLETLR